MQNTTARLSGALLLILRADREQESVLSAISAIFFLSTNFLLGVYILTSKEYLNKSRTLDEQINNCLNNISYYRDLATKITSTGGEPHGSGVPDRISAIVVKIVTLENELDDMIDKLISEQKNIQNRINQLPSEAERKILTSRYLHRETWPAIAAEMRVSVQWVHKLHGQALKNFSCLIQ